MTTLQNATPVRNVKQRLLFHQESSENVTLSVEKPLHARKQVRKSIWDSVFELSNEEDNTLASTRREEDGEEEEEDGVTKILFSTFKLERFVWFGVALCLDQLLSFAIVLPLRVIFGILARLTGSGGGKKKEVTRAQYHRFVFDVCVLGITLTALVLSLYLISAAQIYHSIRLQTFMKLYVVINIAEVLDRLLCSMGNDLFDLLGDSIVRNKHAKTAIRVLLCSIYTCAHAILFYIRVLTLSVAMNSSSDALFTILVSNNFVELKGSVFKRSTEENLFQISCSDVVERFVLTVFMGLVGLSEYSGQGANSTSTEPNAGGAGGATSILPQFVLLWSMVLLVEVMVDWIKHSFICRFNSDIRAREAYDRFLGILATDFSRARGTIFPQVAKRLGLPVIPLCVVMLRVVLFDAPELNMGFALSLLLGGLVIKFVLRVTCLEWILHWAIAEESISPCVSPAPPAAEPVVSATLPVSSPPPLPPRPPQEEEEEERLLATPPPPSSQKKALVVNNNNIASSSTGGTGRKKQHQSSPKTLFKVNRFETTS